MNTLAHAGASYLWYGGHATTVPVAKNAPRVCEGGLCRTLATEELMKTAIPAMLALVLASGASAQAKAANNPQELINIENAWAKAAVARDAATLNRIVAPDWHGQNHH